MVAFLRLIFSHIAMCKYFSPNIFTGLLPPSGFFSEYFYKAKTNENKFPHGSFECFITFRLHNHRSS